MNKRDEELMALALSCAQAAAQRGEVPVGAVLIDAAGVVLAEASNSPIARADPTAHAEILALREACAKLGNYRLPEGCTLYVTLEPCVMCAGAIAQARVAALVFGAADEKGGAVVSGPRVFEQPTCHWRPEVRGGVLAQDCAEALRAFFRARR